MAALAPSRRACDDNCLMQINDAQLGTSAARMASGMTSRARRPESHIFAG